MLSVLVVAATLAVALSPAATVARADAGPPQPPRDLYAEAPRADQVVLSWRPGVEPPPGETTPPGEHYQVLRDGQLIADTTDLKLTDRWLSEQRRYSYVVRAVDPQGETAATSPLEITTPAFAAGFELGPYLQQPGRWSPAERRARPGADA